MTFLLGNLLALITKGTPRIQRMTIRLSRKILPLQSSDKLFGIIHPGKDLIASLFGLVGQAYWGSHDLNAKDTKLKVRTQSLIEEKDIDKGKRNNDMNDIVRVSGWRDGHVAIALATEIVLLLRILLEGSWRAPLTTTLTNALMRIPAIVHWLKGDLGATSESSDINREDIWQALAALCVIGGHSCGLQVGARVDVIDNQKKTRGTIIVYDRLNNRARVLCVFCCVSQMA
jgi:hypothetical protein